MLHPPCKDCPDRYIGCHAKCDKYQAYDQERKIFLKLKFEANKKEDDLWGTARNRKGWQRQ